MFWPETLSFWKAKTFQNGNICFPFGKRMPREYATPPAIKNMYEFMPKSPKIGKWNKTDMRMLLNALAKIEKADLLKEFLDILFTQEELLKAGRRLNAAKLLSLGAPYRETAMLSSVSSKALATISKRLPYGGDLHYFLKELPRDFIKKETMVKAPWVDLKTN